MFAIIPYLLNIVNFLGYPRTLDGEKHPNVTIKNTFLELWKTLKYAFTHSALRRTGRDDPDGFSSLSASRELPFSWVTWT